MKQQGSHILLQLVIGIILLIFSVASLLGQDKNISDQAITDLLNKTESVLGLDDELVNGEFYYQKNISANGNPFYLTGDWTEGSVTVNGKTHHKLSLKLNVEDNILIMKVTQKSGSTSSIALNQGFIDSFDLGMHHFINSQVDKENGLPQGYYEVLYEGVFSFFANYRKTFVSEYNTKNPYGKYSKTFISYYLSDNGQLVKLSSKGSLLKYFEPYKKEIKRFMSQNKIKYGKADSFQLHLLMQYCDDLVNKQ